MPQVIKLHQYSILSTLYPLLFNMKLKIISAGAGSGKTYRLTQEMVALLKSGVRADGIIATTFTKKAAAELQERVRIKLLEEGLTDEANDLANALIGTVHGLGVKLLKRFSFEAGVSPDVDIIADEDQQLLFNNSLATVLTHERITMMEDCSDRLGLNKREYYDWRREVKRLTDIARANDFSVERLEHSKRRSIESFGEQLGERSKQSGEEFNKQLKQELEEAISRVEQNEDGTAVTEKAVRELKNMGTRLRLKGYLYWHEWAKIGKLKIGAKSRDDIADLTELARKHNHHPDFHQDIENFISNIFDIAIAALEEYDEYKKQRGLIDYIDMEIHVKRLLDQSAVREILEEELDLLMVDEFQDTNPIQLEIFLKLSQIAKHSVWVGDPKQSIYGFRGADPKLMMAIIEENGGVKPEDIQEYSWRSREDIVLATNALFCKAFKDLPTEQIALKPKRCKLASPDSQNKENEPIEMADALHHWHFETEPGVKRTPGRPWMENCIAKNIRRVIEQRLMVMPKDETEMRAIQAGDIAILCRSNSECLIMAEALHQAGLHAAIARSGLLKTAEASLIIACLKFILHPSDSLSVAEILLLATRMDIEEIIDNRLEFLDRKGQEDQRRRERWAAENPFIQKLNEIRPLLVELSSSEILNLLLEEFDLRRIISRWGRSSQRMDNIDELRKLSLQYEEACNRMHSAASLGGFLLWLSELVTKEKDMQGSGQGVNAVNVLTYHKSKGLEWPLVICHSLEGKLRDEVWGFDIMDDSTTVDLDNLTAERWIRYWINPYADQHRNTPLWETLQANEVKKMVRTRALLEEARLLYVGITRARDYLVFPTRQNTATKWLNRCWQEGQEDLPTLDATQHETPWEWNGLPLGIDIYTEAYPRDFVHYEAEEEDVLYFEERTSPKDRCLDYYIDVNKEVLDLKVKIIQNQQYGPPLDILEKEELNTIAKALKILTIGDHPSYPMKDRLLMEKAIIQRLDLPESIKEQTLLRHSSDFHKIIQEAYQPKKIYRKYPIQLFHQDRLFETYIDFLLETEKGFVIIQNSSFAGEPKNRKTKALELKSWMHLSRLAVQKIFGEQKVELLLHFVLGSELMEMSVQEVKKSSIV